MHASKVGSGPEAAALVIRIHKHVGVVASAPVLDQFVAFAGTASSSVFFRVPVSKAIVYNAWLPVFAGFAGFAVVHGGG
jgi:hypothetical protein